MKPKPFKLKPIPAALLVAFSFPGGAQAAGDEASKTEQLPEVRVSGEKSNDGYAEGVTTVGGKTPTPIRDIPQSVTVINRQVMNAQAATSVVAALRNVPGITLSAGEGGQIGDNINLRGFSARTDVYLDGFRDRGQFRRDTFSLEAVEVLKGPSSMLFGRGSTGGVINQSSKRPSLRPISEITASVGTEDYYRTTADFGRALSDTSAFRVAVMGQDTQSTRDVVRNQDYGLAPSLRFGIGTATEVTFSSLIQRNDDIPDYGFPLIRYQGQSVSRPVKALPDQFYGFADDKFKQNVSTFGAQVRHKLSEALTLRNHSQYIKYTITAAPTPLGGLVNPVTGVAQPPPPEGTSLDQLWFVRQTRDRKIFDSSLFNQTDLIAKLKTGPVQHTLTTGMELGRDEYRNKSFTWTDVNSAPATAPGNVTGTPPVNLGNPNNGPRPTPASTLRLPQSDTRTTADTVAVYVNDQLDLTEQWKLVGGLRWDNFSATQNALTYTYTYPINPANPNPKLSLVTLSSDDSMLSTRAGVLYQPDELQSYYVSYGTSFNPSAEAVTLAANNASLDPEKSRSFEVGTKWDLLNGNLSVSTAVFRVEKTNARTVDALNPGVQSLDGNIRVDGFEVSSVGQILPNWQVIGGYTFLDGEIVESNDVGTGVDLGIRAQGKRSQNTPRHSMSLWTTYKFTPAWEVGGGMLASTQRFVNNFQTAAIPGFKRFDATVAYLQPHYDLRLNLENLTDKVYFEAASGGRATPVTGRRGIVSLTYRY